MKKSVEIPVCFGQLIGPELIDGNVEERHSPWRVWAMLIVK